MATEDLAKESDFFFLRSQKLKSNRELFAEHLSSLPSSSRPSSSLPWTLSLSGSRFGEEDSKKKKTEIRCEMKSGMPPFPFIHTLVLSLLSTAAHNTHPDTVIPTASFFVPSARTTTMKIFKIAIKIPREFDFSAAKFFFTAIIHQATGRRERRERVGGGGGGETHSPTMQSQWEEEVWRREMESAIEQSKALFKTLEIETLDSFFFLFILKLDHKLFIFY